MSFAAVQEHVPVLVREDGNRYASRKPVLGPAVQRSAYPEREVPVPIGSSLHYPGGIDTDWGYRSCHSMGGARRPGAITSVLQVHDSRVAWLCLTAQRHSGRFQRLGFVLLGLAFSAICAMLTYYGAVAPVFRNRVVAVLVGVVLGASGAVGLYFELSGGSDSDDQ